jgi:sec-independent protein translocase protein TatB
MPDIGGLELLVIAIVALIVVGPKDLPSMFRKLGEMTGRVRAMSKDFQRAMDQAADETGMTGLKDDLNSMSKFTNPRKMGMDALDFLSQDIDPTQYEEGSETRRIAEEQAAIQQEQRATIAAKKRAQEQAIAAKQDAANPRPPIAAAAGSEPAADMPVSDASPKPAVTPAVTEESKS